MRLVTPRAFLRFFLFVALAIGLAGAGADGDLWGHVRFGRDLVANHQLVAHEAAATGAKSTPC